jgi:hypothetical protein
MVEYCLKNKSEILFHLINPQVFRITESPQQVIERCPDFEAEV